MPSPAAPARKTSPQILALVRALARQAAREDDAAERVQAQADGK
jgi:hypothetical protein